jgi:hypothetical protein
LAFHVSKRRSADPLPTANRRRRLTTSLLTQDHDDLLLSEPQPLLRPSPLKRTLPQSGGDSGVQVTWCPPERTWTCWPRLRGLVGLS